MDIFEKANNFTDAQVLNFAPLETAADGMSYVCPFCGHGRHGDGIKPKMYKGRLAWHCHGKCGRHMTNVDIIAIMHGVDARVDKAGAARVLRETCGLEGDNSFFPLTEDFQDARASGQSSVRVGKSGKGINLIALGWNETKAALPGDDDAEPRKCTRLYNYCRRHYSLKKFLDGQGGTWRGLTYETLNRAGALIHGEFHFGDKERPAIVFPYDETFCFIRSTVDKARTVLKDTKRKLYVAAPITLDVPNFVSEGEIDALSIAQVLPGCGSVATGGVGNVEMMIRELDKQFGDAEHKPSFIVLLDNDEGGRGNAQTFVDRLRASGYKAVFLFLDGNSSTKTDANDLLQRGELARRLVDVIEDAERELNGQTLPPRTEPTPPPTTDKATDNSAGKSDVPAQDNAVAKDDSAAQPTKPAEPSATDKPEFGRSIANYFSTKFFADVAKIAEYSGRKTGFDNLDEKLTLLPGLYLLGGLPATGKTTFATQLLEQLARNGEHCIYCSYEMSELELFAKSLARHLYKRKLAGEPLIAPTSFDIRSGRGNHVSEVQAAVKSFFSLTDKFSVAELSDTTVTELFAKLEPVIANADKSPIVCLDYLQILPSDKDTPKAAIDATLRNMKDFQRRTNSTFVVISSFNRQNYWQPVSFESFKESGAIEYSADAVLGLETFVATEDADRKEAVGKAYKSEKRTIKLTCLKNRNGGAFDCYFKYHCKHDYFVPCTEREAKTADDDECCPPPDMDVVDET